MKRRRIWVRLGLVVALFALLWLGQALQFCLFGPPSRWTDDVSRKPLRVTSDAASPARAYVEEFRRKWTQSPLCPPAYHEMVPELGIELRRTDDHRLYFRRNGEWQMLVLPAEIVFREARIALGGDEIVVVASRRNSWLPYEEKYGRYLRSLLDPELRPTDGLYEVRLPGGETRYLCPGWFLRPSPDRRRVAFLRSAGAHGSHSLHILDVATDEVRNLASLTEGDPGSGISFDYAWSDDSRALGLRGRLHGHRGDVVLIYTLDSDRFWDASRHGE